MCPRFPSRPQALVLSDRLVEVVLQLTCSRRKRFGSFAVMSAPDPAGGRSCRATRNGMATCPICGRTFGVNQIMEHADKCATRSEAATVSAPARPKQPSAGKVLATKLSGHKQSTSSSRVGAREKTSSTSSRPPSASAPKEGSKVFDMVRLYSILTCTHDAPFFTYFTCVFFLPCTFIHRNCPHVWSVRCVARTAQSQQSAKLGTFIAMPTVG